MSWFTLIPLFLIVIMIMFLVLVWLRKVQYDAIHRNFLSMEEKFGGKIVRKSSLFRPFYAGKVKEREIRVGFTSEKYQNKRTYYVNYTLECSAKIQGSIIENKWYESRDEKSKEDMLPLLDGKFWLQLKGNVPKSILKKLETQLKNFPDFSYALIANTGMILERVTEKLVDESEAELNNMVISGMVKIANIFEKG